MRSFTTLAFAASALISLATAQITYDSTTGTYTCAKPNAAYCIGGSLHTDIIIRCNGYIGTPGNCNDNLSGEFPAGVSWSPCYEPSAESGQAACSKNCVVYGDSGNYNGTFTLPGCTPIYPTSSLSTSSTATAGNSTSVTYTSPTSTTSIYTSVNSTSTYSWLNPTSYPTSKIILLTTGSAYSTGFPPTPTNGTIITSGTGIPVGPTTSPPIVFHGGAAANNQGVFALVGASLFAAIFL